MKKNIFKFLLPAVLLFSCLLQAEASITSVYDINLKKSQLTEIAQNDYLSFVNKNELIGYRLDTFNMLTAQYKSNATLIIERLNKNLEQIRLINESSEFSDSDKQIQINKIYQDSDAALYDLDSKSLDYIFSIRNSMPPITYNRYAKKFQEYYNSFQLTNSELSIK